MTGLRNIYAWLVITYSNFNASFGRLIQVVFIAAVSALLIAGIVRTLLAGRALKRTAPLKAHAPDPELAKRAAQSLSESIRFKTVTGNAKELAAYVEYLKGRYPLVFSRFDVLPSPGQSLLLRWRVADTSENPVLLGGHLDVVPAGEGWSRDPFAGEITEDGFIWGRGAIDCKNVVVGQLEALESLISEGFEPKRDIFIAFGHDEETGGFSGAAKVAELFSHRNITFDMVLDEGGYISEEHFGRKRFPAAVIGMGEKGCCYYLLTASGQGGHSSTPPVHTAVGVLSEAICRIEAAPPKPRLLPIIAENMRLSAPAMRFIHRFTVCNLPFSKLLLFRAFRRVNTVNPLFRTTFACTQVKGSEAPNVLPGTAEAVVNARVLQGDTPKAIGKYLRSLMGGLPVSVELTTDIPPSKISEPEGVAYKLVTSALHDRYPRLSCIPTILPITTDSRHYEGMSDNVIKFMPFIMKNELYATMHNRDERISTQCLGAGVELYKAIFKKL